MASLAETVHRRSGVCFNAQCFIRLKRKTLFRTPLGRLVELHVHRSRETVPKDGVGSQDLFAVEFLLAHGTFPTAVMMYLRRLSRIRETVPTDGVGSQDLFAAKFFLARRTFPTVVMCLLFFLHRLSRIPVFFRVNFFVSTQ